MSLIYDPLVSKVYYDLYALGWYIRIHLITFDKNMSTVATMW